MKRIDAKPGKSIIFKLRHDEETLILEWFDTQEQFSDSIRYLIQKEIALNGIQNLQTFIPSKRSIQSIRDQQQLMQNDQIQLKVDSIHNKQEVSPPLTHEQPNKTIQTLEPTTTLTVDSGNVIQTEDGTISQKRKADKKFSADTMNSYS